MDIDTMDLENQINSVENISYINFYQISNNNCNIKRASYMGLIVIYNQIHYINLCSNDKMFEKLRDKVIIVFKREKQFGNIKTNDFTNSVLNSTFSEDNISDISLYQSHTGYYNKLITYCNNEILIFKKMLFFSFTKIFEYYSLINEEILLYDIVPGYRNDFVILYSKKKEKGHISLHYQKISSCEYEFTFGNILDKSCEGCILIEYMQDKVNVKINCNIKKVCIYFVFDFINRLICKKVYSDNILLSDVKEECNYRKCFSKDNQSLLLSLKQNIDKYTVYTLPWGEKYFYNEKMMNEPNNVSVHSGDFFYFIHNKNVSHVLNFLSNSIYSCDKFLCKMDCIGIEKYTYLTKRNHLLVESHFFEVENYTYEEDRALFDNKYFYQISRKNFLDNTTTDCCVSFDFINEDLSEKKTAYLLSL